MKEAQKLEAFVEERIHVGKVGTKMRGQMELQNKKFD